MPAFRRAVTEAHAVRVDPYLQFNGRCDEALDFYGRAIGARVVFLTRFGETPGMPTPPHLAGKVMHAVAAVGDSSLLVTDGGAPGPEGFHGFALALSAGSDAEAEALFAALAEGGQVTAPMGPTPFASRFGILVDRFGLAWNVVRQEGQP